MTWSASPRSSSQVAGGAIGTATTICAGRCSRSARTAARMLEPVASPSSTRITVFPSTLSAERPPRYTLSRRASSSCSRAATSSIVSGGTAAAPTTSSLRTADAAARDRAHRQLGLLGKPELADDEDVERHLELACDLEGDRDASAREREHDHVLAASVLRQGGRQLASGLGSVAEACLQLCRAHGQARRDRRARRR